MKHIGIFTFQGWQWSIFSAYNLQNILKNLGTVGQGL